MDVNSVSFEAGTAKSPVVIIRERIASKRLYEARFLFRQLSEELTSADRKQLAQQLENTIHTLEQKHRDAVYYAEQGTFDRAADLLEEIEQATVDFPNFDREKERLSPVDPILAMLNRDKEGYPPSGNAANRAVSSPIKPQRQRPVVRSSPGKPSRRAPNLFSALILALPAVLAIIVIFLLVHR